MLGFFPDLLLISLLDFLLQGYLVLFVLVNLLLLGLYLLAELVDVVLEMCRVTLVGLDLVLGARHFFLKVANAMLDRLALLQTVLVPALVVLLLVHLLTCVPLDKVGPINERGKCILDSLNACNLAFDLRGNLLAAFDELCVALNVCQLIKASSESLCELVST
mmetsp:Transcript_3507/g.4048  ORF Transcript_3507/g.4048 Transcript_3507/m.4048 type:complete len:163 (-) Transcript_3507:145-633(-)